MGGAKQVPLIFVERVELPPYHYAVTVERVASRS
jgi:hypothetical protein